jgi:zinc and cadmium transporter
MSTLLWILLATIINSLLGLIGVFSLWIKEKLLNKLLICLIAFSAGALLGGAFFHLLEESFEHLSVTYSFVMAIGGFILFILIEGYFHWHHCKCKPHPFTYLILIGDSIHNFIDGLVIAAGFFVNPLLGIVTTLMILGHEAPQEMGLFGVLLYGKYEKGKALLYSLLAQSTCILGGITGYLISSKAEVFSHYLVPFAAGGFIYIAASDLIPEIHKMHKHNFKRFICSFSFLILGLLFMIAIKLFFGG